jgi:hypothetical protein
MTVIAVLTADDVTDDPGDLAPAARRTPGESGGYVPGGLAGYVYDGEAYCPECAGDIEVVSADDGEQYTVESLPAGHHDSNGFGVGVVACTDEFDYPGASCGSCLRRLQTNVLIYDDGGAHPDPVVEVRDPDGMGVFAEAFLLAEDGTEVRIMLAEEFRPYGDAGDTSWIPREDVVAGLDDDD